MSDLLCISKRIIAMKAGGQHDNGNDQRYSQSAGAQKCHGKQ